MQSTADMFEHVLYDEARHTWYANKWLRWLLSDDDAKVVTATAAAHERYNAEVERLGCRTKLKDPNYLEAMASRPIPIDPALRAHAGFTVSEITIMQGLRHWPS
jgi:uncharacterized ferritin-like protein (DUF455 family)